MKFHVFLSSLLVAGSLALASAPAHATFGLLGGLGSVCADPIAPTGIDCGPVLGGGLFGGNTSCDLFGNLLGGVGSVVCPTPVVSVGTLCNLPSVTNNNCDLFGNLLGGGSNGGLCDLFGNPIGGNNGGGIGNNCNPPGGGGTGGGGTSPVPEPGSIALLALGATALGGTVLRRRK